MATLSVAIRVPRRDLVVDVAFATDGVLAIVGPSGAGKSTILRAVAGLDRPADGRIALGDAVWFGGGRDVPVERRGIGFVFQDYALFPHLSVAANVGYGGPSRAEEMMARVGIGHLRDARPGDLSGGERQRVAVARALAGDPAVLLLDEPTASLDALTREIVRGELAALIGELAIPTLVVTHDFEEAATLADRVGVLVEGRIVQVGAPADLVSAPRSPFVAGLTGCNVLRGVAEPGPDGLTRVRLRGGTSVLSSDAAVGSVAVAVHPTQIVLTLPGQATGAASAQNRIVGTVSALTPIGNRVRVRIGSLVAEVTAASTARLGLAVGGAAVASFKATAARLVPIAPGQRESRRENV